MRGCSGRVRETLNSFPALAGFVAGLAAVHFYR